MIFGQRRIIHAYTRISTRSPLQFQHAISHEISLRFFSRFRIFMIIFVSHFFLLFVLIFYFEQYIMNTLVVHSTSAIYLPQIYLCRINCVILHNEQVCTNWMYFSILFSLEENECRSNRSKCEQLCVNTISGYYCECKKGYQLNGKYSCKGRLFGNYNYHLSEQNTAIIRVKRDLDPRRRSPLSALLNVGGGREGGWFNLGFFKDTLCSIQS